VVEDPEAHDRTVSGDLPSRQARDVAAGRAPTWQGGQIMIEGTLIGESVRVGAELAGVRLVSRSIRRVAAGDEPAGQPELWTLITFEADETDADVLADALAKVLEPEGGWYCDFRSPEETFVVYSGRTFRYRRGDKPGREEAAAYGRSVGVPESQLDWPV
jgi:hypothetical protein